jgi:hypothetical protein
LVWLCAFFEPSPGEIHAPALGSLDNPTSRSLNRRSHFSHFANEKFIVALSANAYAKAANKAVQEEYVQRFRFDPRITKPGAVGYLHLEGWPSDVRFIVEWTAAEVTQVFPTDAACP